MNEIRGAIRRQHLNLTEAGRFEQNAAPEAIAAYIADAVAALGELQEHIRWLSTLHGRRVTEKDLGTWP